MKKWSRCFDFDRIHQLLTSGNLVNACHAGHYAHALIEQRLGLRTVINGTALKILGAGILTHWFIGW